MSWRFGTPVTFSVDARHEQPTTAAVFDTNGRLTRDLRSTDYKQVTSTVTGHVKIEHVSSGDVKVDDTGEKYVISAHGQTLILEHEPKSLNEDGFGYRPAFEIASDHDMVEIRLIDQQISQDPNWAEHMHMT